MEIKEIRTIGVVGAGVMGQGIAQVALQSGFKAIVRDIDEKILAAAKERIGKGLEKGVEKGKLTEAQKEQMLKDLTLTISMKDLRPVDFIVEAVVEEFEVKKQVFQELDAICRPPVILASNTSSISITRIASTTKRPEKVIGMHFMNPAPLIQLVEVVPGMKTSKETIAATMDLAEKLGKKPVRAEDYPGFLINRILLPMINEAIYALMEGVGTVEAIDTVMRLGANHPMGPLALADLVGLDVCLAILKVMHDSLGDDKYRPCPLLAKMVDAGLLGRKTGQGFYKYA